MTPEDIHILIPEPVTVILHDKGDFADVMKLRVIRWRDNPGLSGQAQRNDKGPHKMEAGGSEPERWKDGRRG